MAFRKRTDQLLIRVLVGFTPSQLEHIDGQSDYGRGAYLRWLVDQDRRRTQLQGGAYQKRLEVDPDQPLDYATPSDYEITFDAYRDHFFQPLYEAFNDGQRIDHLIPTFAGLMENLLQKRALDTQIQVFLREKMFEVGNTNDSEST